MILNNRLNWITLIEQVGDMLILTSSWIPRINLHHLAVSYYLVFLSHYIRQKIPIKWKKNERDCKLWKREGTHRFQQKSEGDIERHEYYTSSIES